jgi:hypothetical protein
MWIKKGQSRLQISQSYGLSKTFLPARTCPRFSHKNYEHLQGTIVKRKSLTVIQKSIFCSQFYVRSDVLQQNNLPSCTACLIAQTVSKVLERSGLVQLQRTGLSEKSMQLCGKLRKDEDVSYK